MSDLTFKNLFFADEDVVGALLDRDSGGVDESLATLRHDIKEQLPKVSLKSVEKEIGAKIGEVLNVGLDEVLISGWTKYRSFQEYADSTKHPPEETLLVPLARHTIKSSHNPHVDLLIRDMQIGSIELKVDLALKLEGVVLKVQAGRIWDVRGGSGQASGSLQCQLKSRLGEKEILNLKKETKTFQLRGAIRLGAEGVAIPVRGEPREAAE